MALKARKQIRDTLVVIPNHNGIEHLETCLKSLARQTSRRFMTVVVDNGSTDGSCEFIQDRFPRVQLIHLGKNTGFAAAVNRGIRAGKSSYVALLNNDVELDPHWLEALVNGLENNDGLGSVACKMLNFERRQEIDAAGDILRHSIAVEPRGHGETDHGQYDEPDEVFGPCAGAALYRREIFERIGMFDESFFAFYEDVDLDFRMQLQGWRVGYVPKAVCYHKRGGTMKRMQPFAARLHVRNQILYIIKNIPSQMFISHGVSMIGSLLKNWFLYMRSGWPADVVRGVAEACVMVPSFLMKRREIQKTRRVSVEYLASLMR